MVTPSVGSVVTVRFPFSDLSATKLRPAVVLADVERGDWVLCQLTSNAYSDAGAIQLQDENFANGSLKRVSFARPGKIFTAHETLMVSKVGNLNDESLRKIVDAIIHLLQSSIAL